MRPVETAAQLSTFERRGAGTDAERRAAAWLAGELRAARREASLETFWCRPNWPLAHAWHCLLAIAGSLVMVSHAVVGGALVLAALLFILGDWLTGRSPGRRLTRERASQNVVSPLAAPPTAASPVASDDRVTLIVTANYDAGRTGLIYRERLRATTARLKRVAGGGRLTPGWLGWVVIELVWLIVVAVLRRGGAAGTPIGIAQLIPTAALVIELAGLLELAGAPFGPAAGDNGSGTAVALALVRALDAAPPRRLRVQLVLQGGGDGAMVGLRRHLRAHRKQLTRRNTIVLGIGPAGAGRPAWWISDGSLVPLRYPARLRRLAHAIAGPAGAGRRGRGVTPAFPARVAGIPALAIGCLDDRGLAPRSHQRTDAPDVLDPAAADALLEFALTLVDAIDADLGDATGRSAAAPAVA
jgi:Peptidase family M28